MNEDVIDYESENIMKNIKSNRKLYNFKKIFVMITAVLIGSILGGYYTYKVWGAVKAGVCSGSISLAAGILIILWVVYHGNKESKD